VTLITPPAQGPAALPGTDPRRNSMEHFIRPAGLPPVSGYSHAVACTGRMIAVSGQVPADGQGRLVGQDDPRAQVRQVFENLTTALAAAGAAMDQVVKLTVYLTDMADLDVFRQVRDEYISPGRPPASSLVQVSGLVNPAFRVEIDALAAA
jgi:reactive intermediate/imine deaminase